MALKFKEVVNSLSNSEIAPWRKKGILFLELLMILVVPALLISTLFGVPNTIADNFAIFSALIVLHVIVQVALCLYVYINKVPSYAWHAVAFIVFLGQIWSGFTIALLSAGT